MGGFLIYTKLDFAAGGWLLLARFALGLHERLTAQAFRYRVLDLVDQTIEAKYLQAAVQEYIAPVLMEGAPYSDPKSYLPLTCQSPEGPQEIAARLVAHN